jgi:peptide-methionine (S)-S-oxide reductase
MRRIHLLVVTLLCVAAPVSAEQAKALFAGGCFWCVEAAFQEQSGVTGVISGFTGGTLANPTYSGNHEGHFEAVEVTYDPKLISYQQLLDLFWHNIDPFDNEGQFCDKGPSYRSAIFSGNPEERKLAEHSRDAVAAHFKGQAIATEIRDAGTFWPVEDYHQDYYLKNPVRYKFYRWNCGRDQRLNEVWGEKARMP